MSTWPRRLCLLPALVALTACSGREAGGNGGSSGLTDLLLPGDGASLHAETEVTGVDLGPDLPLDALSKQPTIVGLSIPNPLKGLATISLTLRDPDSAVVSVQVQRRIGAKGAWKGAKLWPGNVAHVDLAATPEGQLHELKWNTSVDLGKYELDDVWLRLTPSDTSGEGPEAIFGPVAAHNAFNLVEESAARLPPLLGESRFVAPVDLDLDGDLDLVLAVYQDESLVLRNDGEGHFTATPLPGGKAAAVAAAPFDLDGSDPPEVFLATSNEQARVYKSDGKGGFDDIAPAVLGAFNWQLERVLPADLDGDKDEDLVLLCSGTQQPRVLLNEGGKLVDATATHMPAKKLMAASGSLGRVVGGAMPGQPKPDLVIASFLSSQPTLLYRNDGSGHFSDATADLGPPFESIGMDAVLVDLDNDGDLDIFEANIMNLQRVLLGDGKGKFAPLAGALPTDTGPQNNGVLMGVDAAAGDLDLDGNADIFLAASGNTIGYNREIVLFGDGTGRFPKWTNSFFPEDGGDSRHAALVDVDGDGDLDVVLVQSLGQTLLYINK